MSLHASKILFVFLEVTKIKRQRALLEGALGFRVVENRFHPPHHRHGIVKYDAGDAILALNLAEPASFDAASPAGLVQVYEVDSVPSLRERLILEGRMRLERAGECFSDEDGHLYAFVPGPDGRAPGPPRLVELRLEVEDLQRSITFYRDQLGLELVRSTSFGVAFATGNVLLLLRSSMDKGAPRSLRQEGCLTVFHCTNVARDRDWLLEHGVQFRSGIQESEIGWSIQFRDPTGHRFCLYEPSQQSLGWESGSKIREIIGAAEE